MNVIGFVDRVQAARIRGAISTRDRFTQATTWESFSRYLESAEGPVVLNPHIGAGSQGGHRAPPAWLDQRLSATPYVVYVAQRDLRSVMPYVRGAVDILLTDFTDSPSDIRDALRRTMCGSSEIILQRVLDALGDVHPAARVALARLADTAHLAVRVKDLADPNTIAERTLYRAVTNAGFEGVAVIVRVMRAAHAFDLMRFRGHTLEEAARALGYSAARQLSTHLREITRVPIKDLKAMTRSRFLELALGALFRRDGGQAASS